MKIYNSSGVEIADVIVKDDSYRYRAIMGENALTLKFDSFTHIDIPVGSYCDFQGERYTLMKPQNIIEHNTRNFEYTLILESVFSLLGLYKFKDTTSSRLKFSLTEKPQMFLQMLVENLNTRDSGWSVGSYVDSPEKTLSFNHNYCNEALKMIADAFETEFEVVGKVISLRKVEYNKTTPLALSYGKGNGFKSGLKRDNFDNSKVVEILYVQGGERNIDRSKYGSQELLLPKNASLEYEGRNYISDPLGYFIVNADRPLSSKSEDSLDCTHIYPSRVGEVSEVIAVDADKNFYDFKDSSIPASLDYSLCRIAGEKAIVKFESGMLAGKEFDIMQTDSALTGYVHAERRFKLVPQEIDGVTMPNEVFKPAIGDKYAVFGIHLPDAYIEDTEIGAEWKMFREAAKYMYENEDPRFSFTGPLDGIWAKQNWLAIGGKIKLGGYVSFTAEFQTTPVLIRIVGIKDYINKPYSPEIELSNVTVGAGFATSLRKLEATEVVIDESKKESIRFAKRGFREARETSKMLENALLNFSGSINPISVQTMQILLGDNSLQFRFVNSKTTPVEVAHDIVFNTGNKVLTCEGGTIQHMTLGIDTVSSSHAASEYKFWDVPEYNSPALADAGKSYYLYAKVSKSNQTGVFLLSETAIAIESMAGYYHLLVAIVNAEFDLDRSIVPLYGYTEILPGRLTTKRIVSPDGSTYFDLENNEIGGNIKFKSGETYTDVGTGIAGAIATAAADATAKANAAQAAAEALANEAWDYADDVQNELNGLQVGGENIADRTDIQIVAGSNNFALQVIKGSNLPSPPAGSLLKNNQQYVLTVSYSSKSAGTATQYTVLLYDYTTSTDGFSQLVLISSAKQVVKFTTPATGNWSLLIYAGIAGATAGNSVEFKGIMLQEGNRETAYQSAVKYLTQAIQGSTEISGGLVATNIMLLKNALEQITGGLSGLDDDNIGFWTGGTYADALAGLAKIILRKDGSGQLAGGSLSWDLLGQLLFGKVGDSETIKISTGAIPDLAEINNREEYSLPVLNEQVIKDLNNPAHAGIDVNTTYNQEFTLENDGYLTIDASVQYNAGSDIVGFGIDGMVWLEKFNGTSWVSVQQGTIDQLLISLSVYQLSVTKGRFRVRWDVVCGYTDVQGSSATITLNKYCEINYKLNVKKLVIGIDGIALFDSMSDKYLRLSLKDNVAQLRMKLDTDMPGVLLAGDGNASGGGIIRFGAKRHTSKTVEILGTGYYKVWHTIGHNLYTVQLTMKTAGMNGVWETPNNDYFIVRTYSGTSPANTNFSFAVFGDN